MWLAAAMVTLAATQVNVAACCLGCLTPSAQQVGNVIALLTAVVLEIAPEEWNVTSAEVDRPEVEYFLIHAAKELESRIHSAQQGLSALS